MSEGAPAATAASVQPAEGALDANAQAWQEVLKHGTFPGGVLPGMQFAQNFPYMNFMLPAGLMSGPFGLPAEGGEGVKEEGEGSDEGDDTEDEEEEEEDSASKGKRKRSARKRGKGPVQSNSNAALAMLAGAAATKPVVPGQMPATAMHGMEAMWAVNGGAGGLHAGLTPEQQFMQSSDYGGNEGVTDEREVKKMRRKQSNRESARRSRLRKQAECEGLAKTVKELSSENARLKEEKLQLLAQVEILNAKLSMSAFGVHALGGVADHQQQAGDAAAAAKQAQADMHSMAAAMAQAMQVNGGAMLAGMGIPTLDPSALEGKTPEELAAAAALQAGEAAEANAAVDAAAQHAQQAQHAQGA
ncbi:G-box-binding factor 1 [Micractinium conductrix]|uniref:G-box-binding factor 1 n=1 Tax=Micractinium conductrix TaxID=554055 RepID=A0A2P6VLU6_9CHLO|nr:G-box-binding factor 1 [Micractinium conductrix]|eukprot:PSC75059.1 G-box-binding factor 1 [Micractinium conductrix]